MERTNLSTCQGFRERLDDFVDGELSGSDLRDAKAHLADCESCRQEVEETESLIETARALPLDIEPPDSVWPAVNEGLGTSVGWTQAHADREYTKERLIMVAAVLFLAIMPFMGVMPASFNGGWIWGSQGDSTSNAAMADIETKARSYDEAKIVQGTGTIRISNLSGSLRIVGWDENVVKVSGKLGDNIQGVSFDVMGTETFIEVKYPKSGDSQGAWLTVKVPKKAHLDVKTVSATLSIMDCEGAIEATTVSAPLVMHRIDGAIKAKTISGDLRLTGGSGLVEANTTSGHISLRQCKDTLRINSVSGHVDLTSDNVTDLFLKTTTGDINFRGKLLTKGKYYFKSVSGNVNLRLPEGTRANFNSKSMSGMTRTNLDDSKDIDLPRVGVSTLSGRITAYCRNWSKWLDESDNNYADKVRRRIGELRQKKTIVIPLGKEVALKVNDLRSAYFPNHDVAEVVRISEEEFLLRGLKVGSIKLQLWQKNGQLSEQLVEVIAPQK